MKRSQTPENIKKNIKLQIIFFYQNKEKLREIITTNNSKYT